MDYIFKTKVHNHSEIKQNLLDLINLIPTNPIKNKTDDILHTDYNLPSAMHREYFKLFALTINNHLQKMVSELQVDKCEISTYWFQRYGKNGTHHWHTHSCCNYANVYFVELPDNSVATKFKDIDINDIKTGDMITFPGYLLHESPKNLSGKRKTIISFNSNYSDYTEH